MNRDDCEGELMKERQFAYKITNGSSDLVCTHLEFEEQNKFSWMALKNRFKPRD